jgi:hypothetical protein
MESMRSSRSACRLGWLESSHLESKRPVVEFDDSANHLVGEEDDVPLSVRHVAKTMVGRTIAEE